MFTASAMLRSTSSCSLAVMKLASGMHFNEADMANPLAHTPSNPACSIKRALNASWAPTILSARGFFRASRSLVALCMVKAHDAKARGHCQREVFAQRRYCGLVRGPAQVLLRGHRAFDPAGERGVLKKNDASVGAGFVTEAYDRVDAMPCEKFDGSSGELTRSAIERTVAGLKKGQELIMCLLTQIPDSDACKSVVNGSELHRLDLRGSERRRPALELIRFYPARVFDFSEGL